LPIVSSVFVTTIADGDIPVGLVVIPDPYAQYLESLAPGEVPKQVFVNPKQIYVARDSAHLRSGLSKYQYTRQGRIYNGFRVSNSLNFAGSSSRVKINLGS
jgi:hypothetical protein